MSGFILIGATMTIAALLCVAWPLWRRHAADAGSTTPQANLDILRDQLDELRSDLGRGTISERQFAMARAELERWALDEAASASRAEPPTIGGGRRTAISLALLLPVAALSTYLWVGEPDALRNGTALGEQKVTQADVEAMAEKLAKRLEKNPDDPQGWVMLGRSYYTMQRMPDAASAYAKAASTIKDDANLYADYADALAMSQERNIRGKPLELVKQALAINPLQPKALAMGGTEAFYRKDFAAALGYWEKLLPLLPPESEMAKAIAGGIAEARELGGTKIASKAPGAASSMPGAKSLAPQSVSGRVELGAALAGKADPKSTLFIIARAVNGPRIPLAVKRQRASDLPIEFTLDDTMAMSPELRLSQFSDVILTARISKSGNAIAQPGDLQGSSAPVKTGARSIKVVIDSVVP